MVHYVVEWINEERRQTFAIGKLLIVPPSHHRNKKATRNLMVVKTFPFNGDFGAAHWPVKRLIFLLFLFAGQLSPLRTEPFERAEVTKAINLVLLLPQSTPATPGDVVKGDTGLKTGGNSRAELQFPDLTITRLGSNSLFRFLAGTREIILDSGTMLFSAPAGEGGGKVRAGSITAAVTGSEFMISNVGRVKVIALNHKVTVYLTENPKIRTELLPGQMLDIPAGVDRKMPRATTINLGKLLATSKLGESGGFSPLPSQAILAQNTNRQRKAFSLPNTNLTSESAETERSTIESANNSSSQTRQTAAAQIARASTASTSAPQAVNDGTGEDQATNTNNGNRSVENRGNSGNQNPGNRGNSENRGNQGNRGNSGNQGNNENQGNRGNNENRGNSGNQGNSGNNENRGNNGNQGNRGNQGNQRQQQRQSRQ